MANKPAPLIPLAHDQAPPAMRDTDTTLALCGDADSFIQLYRTYLPLVYRYLFARLHDQHDAEDLTALVFERIWTSLPRYRPTGTFKGWLFTIAHRTLVDYYRQHPPRTMPLADFAETLVDSALGPEDRLLVAQAIGQVFQIISTLSQDQQDVISLRFLADLPYAEIARIIGKRESAVKMIAYRALEEVRRRYNYDPLEA